MGFALKISYTVIVLVCLLVSFYFFVRFKKNFFLFAATYFILVSLIDTKVKLLYPSFKFESYHYNIYVLVSSFLFFLMFHNLFKEKYVSSFFNFFSFSIMGSILISVIYKDFHVFSQSTKVIFSLFTCALALFSLAYIIWKPDKLGILQKEHFWVSTGLLLWSTSSIFRFLPADSFHAKEPHFLELIQLGFNIVNILTYVLFLVGILCKGFQSK